MKVGAKVEIMIPWKRIAGYSLYSNVLASQQDVCALVSHKHR